MLPILQGCGVYILPSHFEPWGVSVHEMGVAGFPMLALPDAIGALARPSSKKGRTGRSFLLGMGMHLLKKCIGLRGSLMKRFFK